jgi:signal transduction histidine kinase
MRNIIAGIRPPEVDLGIAHALEGLLDAWSGRSGVAYELETEGEFADLPEPMLVTLYRIAQEALNNVSKHASATKVRVELRRADDEVFLEIRDNGVGMDVDAASRKKGHFGLFGIGERAAQFGGASSVASTPGSGTTIRVVLPVPEFDASALARQPGPRGTGKERARQRADERAE